jgi:hypothetical protein
MNSMNSVAFRLDAKRAIKNEDDAQHDRTLVLALTHPRLCIRSIAIYKPPSYLHRGSSYNAPIPFPYALKLLYTILCVSGSNLIHSRLLQKPMQTASARYIL